VYMFIVWFVITCIDNLVVWTLVWSVDIWGENMCVICGNYLDSLDVYIINFVGCCFGVVTWLSCCMFGVR